MKKLFAIILAFTISTALYAQAISADRLLPNGLRSISTTGIIVDVSGGKYTFSLNAATGEDGELWGVIVGSDIFMTDNAELLMKLDNDEIIHLVADHVNVSALTTPDHYTTYHIGGISETYVEPGREKDYYVSIYKLSEEQIALLESHAIKKMRISLGQSYLEKASGLKKLSRWLSKSATLIRERMQKPQGIHKGITEGF